MADRKLTVENLALPRGISEAQSRERQALLGAIEQPFLADRPGIAAE